MSKRKIYYSKGMSANKLECALCGDTNRQHLQVENLGLATGMSGEDYSFCRSCWNDPKLGKLLLRLLGFKRNMKLRDDCVEARQI